MKNIIYIHPETPMTYPRTIPISLPALIKRIGYKVDGYCSTDIQDESIKCAGVIIIDVHWFFSLKGALTLVKRIRKLNPSVAIVAGGITATEYAHQLIDVLDIDFVVRGDAEIPFPMLIQELVTGGNNFSSIPNLIGKNGLNTTKTIKAYSLNREDFNENEFYDIDFFPKMKRELMHLHKINPGMPPFVYPFLLPFRGCPIACDYCSGAYGEQQKLFGRKVVYRKAEALKNDIEILGRQDWIRFCNCLLDFITLLPDHYSESALVHRSRLKIQYEFTKAPSVDQLQFLLSRFSGGTIHFSTDEMHLTSQILPQPENLIKLIKMVQKDKKYIPILDYSSVYTATNIEYKHMVKEVRKKTNILLYDGSIWWSDFPKPEKSGYANPEDFSYYLNHSLNKKHRMANSLNKVITFIDEFAPQEFSLALRKSYYYFYHTLPLTLG